MTKKDTIIQASIELIPYIGGSLSTLYFGNKQELRFQRIEKFYKEISFEIQKFENRIKDVKSHNLEELSALIEDINEIIEYEHFQSKLELYKHFFIQILIEPVNGNYDERKLYLDIINALTPLQVQIFVHIYNHKSSITNKDIHFVNVDDSLIQGCLSQLKNHGLIDAKIETLIIDSISGSTTEYLYISSFGYKFHRFCFSDFNSI